jgi:hypothetical protein
VVHLVYHQQRPVPPRLGEVQVGRGGDALVRGHVAGQAARGIGRVLGRAHAERVAERVAPRRVGKRLLRLQAQRVPRHDPDHALDPPRPEQGVRGQHGQQRLAPARRDRGEDVAHLRPRRHRARHPKELRLVRAEGQGG